MKLNLINKYPWPILILLLFINWFAYFVYAESSYYFQDLLFEKMHSVSLFVLQDKNGLLVFGLILAVNMLPQMTKLKYQKYFLFLLCTSALFLPYRIVFYPLIAGIYNSITVSTSAWIQLFCPNAMRGLVAGISNTLLGLQDILDTYIENFRAFDTILIHVISALIFLLIMVFLWQCTQVKRINHPIQQKQSPLSLKEFTGRYGFIFASCILVGINSGIFYYTYDEAKLILPTEQPQKFQYMINIISLIVPFVFGWITDKFDYMKVQIQILCAITLIYFVSAVAHFLRFDNLFLLYFCYFLIGIFTNCLWVSMQAICGKYFIRQGLFLAFALYGILAGLGHFFCDLIFQNFFTDFNVYQIVIMTINVLSLPFIFNGFRNFEKQEGVVWKNE